MPLIAPVLDDRSFEDLFAELRNRIPVYNPTWTDHLDSDPGITLLQLFAYLGEGLAAQAAEASIPQPMRGADVTPAVIEAAEHRLAMHIGPMAKVLVRRTVPRATSRVELYEQLGRLIPDPEPRAAFLSGVAADTGTVTAARQSVSPAAAPVASPSAGIAEGGAIPAEALARIEKLFARHIGPMAKVLVRRESRGADGLESLCRALAGHIDKPAERQRFLNDAGF